MDVVQRYGSGYGALSGLEGNPLYYPSWQDLHGKPGMSGPFTGAATMANNFADLMRDPTIAAEWQKYNGISLATAQKVLSSLSSVQSFGTFSVLVPGNWVPVTGYNTNIQVAPGISIGPNLLANMLITSNTPDGSIAVVYGLKVPGSNYQAQVAPIAGRTLQQIINSGQIVWTPPVLHSGQHAMVAQFLTAVALAVGGIAAAATLFPATSTTIFGAPLAASGGAPVVAASAPLPGLATGGAAAGGGISAGTVATGASVAGTAAKAGTSLLSTGQSQAGAFNLPTNPSLTPTGFDASGNPSLTPSVPGLLPTAGAAIQQATTPAPSGFNWGRLLTPASSALTSYQQAQANGQIAPLSPAAPVATAPSSGVPSLLLPLGIGAAVLALVLFNR